MFIARTGMILSKLSVLTRSPILLSNISKINFCTDVESKV